MAVEIGTADNYLDLLEKLRVFLTTNEELVSAGQQWEVLSEKKENYAKQVFFKAPGLTGKENIFINIRAVYSTNKDVYNWQISGAVGYEDQFGLDEQPGNKSVYSFLWQHKIPYWFVANGQRVIVVAKVSTVYMTMYMGKILPYGTPNHFPYPVLISGCGESWWKRWSSTLMDTSCIFSPGKGSYFYYPDGTWKQVSNRYGTETSYRVKTDQIMVSPTADGGFLRTSSSDWDGKPISPNPDGSYVLLPLILFSTQLSQNVYGEIDGLYWISGLANASENVITIGEKQYLVVQNIFRTTWDEYGAVELR